MVPCQKLKLIIIDYIIDLDKLIRKFRFHLCILPHKGIIHEIDAILEQ